MSLLAIIGAAALFAAAAVVALLAALAARRRAGWYLVALAMTTAGMSIASLAVAVSRNALMLPDSLLVEPFLLSLAAFSFVAMFALARRDAALAAEIDRLSARDRILHGILENSPASISVRDPDGNFILYGAAYRKTFDLDEDCVGQSSYDLLPLGIAERATRMDQQLIDSGEPIIEELEGNTPTGYGRNLIVRFPVYDQDGGVMGVGRIATDVTLLHDAREKLSQQQARYELALSAGRIGIWEWDVKTDAVRYSDNWLKLMGIATEKALNSFEKWLSHVVPEDRQAAAERAELYRTAEAGLTTPPYQLRLKNGQSFWFETRISVLLDNDGEVETVIGVDTDVTDRVLAEQTLKEREIVLREILDHLPVSLLIKDRERRYIVSNKTYQEWHAREEPNLVGVRFEELSDGPTD